MNRPVAQTYATDFTFCENKLLAENRLQDSNAHIQGPDQRNTSLPQLWSVDTLCQQ